MSNRKAQIINGVVVNVIEVDAQNLPEWAADWPDAGNASAGWLWDGEAFSEPVTDQPSPPVLNRQQWAILLSVDYLGQILDGVIAAMPAGFEKAALRAVAYESESYSLENTLAIVANLRGQGVSGLPTDEAITMAWMQAAQFRGAADLIGGGV